MQPEQEIIEGNKLIAEFMGVRFSNIDGFYYYGNLMYTIPVLHPNVWRLSASELKYHTSWGWLMPVVEKISLIPYPKDNGWSEQDYKDMMAYPYPRTFGMRDTAGNFMVRLNANQLFVASTLIEATWLAVKDYIHWYNQNKNS